MNLPVFKYFPDPVGLGSLIESTNVCLCCNQARGYVIAINPYADEDYCEELCPWCVADGSAAEFIKGEFNNKEGIGNFGAWEEVDESVLTEVATRTPGFAGIQDERWFTHCSDAAEFHGYVTKEKLVAMGPKVVEEYLDSLGEETYEEFLEMDGSSELLDMISEGDDRSQGYLFKCSHCGCYGGYVDYL